MYVFLIIKKPVHIAKFRLRHSKRLLPSQNNAFIWYAWDKRNKAHYIQQMSLNWRWPQTLRGFSGLLWLPPISFAGQPVGLVTMTNQPVESTVTWGLYYVWGVVDRQPESVKVTTMHDIHAFIYSNRRIKKSVRLNLKITVTIWHWRDINMTYIRNHVRDCIKQTVRLNTTVIQQWLK